MGVLLIVIVGCVLYSRDQGVIRGGVDFGGETFFLFERSPCSSVLMYSGR